MMDKAWAGVDAGKEFHWAHVLDASGRELLSRKVENDEADIFKLIDEALSLAEEVVWAVDQPGGSAALLLALLVGTRSESPLRPRSHRGSSPRRLPRRVQNRCPRCPRHRRSGSDEIRPQASSSPVSKRSPSCSSCSVAAATSSPTRAGPSPA